MMMSTGERRNACNLACNLEICKTTRSSTPQSLLICLILLHQSVLPVASSSVGILSSGARTYSGQCFPEDTAVGPAYACADNPTYYSHKGLPCSFHAELISASDGENCFHQWLAGVDTDATWLAETYDQDQIFDLIVNCPCACNVKCFDSNDDGDGEEQTANPTQKPISDNEENGPSATVGSYHNIGGIGLSDKELNADIGAGVRENDQSQAAESRTATDETNEMAPSIVAPAVAVDNAPFDKLQEATTDAAISSSDKFGFALPDSLEFVAMIAGAAVGLIVMYVSVFSLIQNMRKRKRLGSDGNREYHNRNGRDDLQLASSLSDISESAASVESLSTEDKMRLYNAWRLATAKRRGIEDGFDIVEP